MSTPAEAFAKFQEWSKFRTMLKLTISEMDAKPLIVNAQVTATDQLNLVVGFTEHRSRKVFKIDFIEALFTVGARTLMAEHTNGEFLKCEEI